VVPAAGFVVHAGAGGPGEPEQAVERAAAVLSAVLAQTPDDTRLLVELMAATAGAVASTIEEAVRLFDAVGDERLGLVLDTCHLFVAGYGLDTPEGVDALFGELGASGIGARLALVHLNDAKFGRGTRRDRHEVVGEGEIGPEGFRAFLHRPEVRELSVVVETPASGDRRRAELDLIRSLAG
jgi:deoxyribonuclease-4